MVRRTPREQKSPQHCRDRTLYLPPNATRARQCGNKASAENVQMSVKLVFPCVQMPLNFVFTAILKSISKLYGGSGDGEFLRPYRRRNKDFADDGWSS